MTPQDTVDISYDDTYVEIHNDIVIDELSVLRSYQFRDRPAGSALPMTLRGAWAMGDDGVLKLTGVSDVANQKVPFRFVSDRAGPDRFKRHEVKSGTEYRTGCKRSE